MMLTKTTHPPAGANPLAIMLGGTGWSFLFMPVFDGFDSDRAGRAGDQQS